MSYLDNILFAILLAVGFGYFLSVLKKLDETLILEQLLIVLIIPKRDGQYGHDRIRVKNAQKALL
jgi:hypothetical protein